MTFNADRESIQAFLDELQALSEKHDFWLDSCGCCESIALLSPTRGDAWLNEKTEAPLVYQINEDGQRLTARGWYSYTDPPSMMVAKRGADG